MRADLEYLVNVLERARTRLGPDAVLKGPLRSLVQEPAVVTPPPAGQLLVRSGERIRVVSLAQVLHAASEGNYVRLHLGPRDSVLVRSTLEGMMQQLGPAFVRTHRCAAARTGAIRELRTSRRGTWRAVLTDGTVVPVGRKYRGGVQGNLRGHDRAQSGAQEKT